MLRFGMRWIAHSAPVAGCLTTSGNSRSIAGKIAFGEHAADAALTSRARNVMRNDYQAGRVHSLSAWRDTAVAAQLGSALGAPLASALRADFEWYQCRGAFFHNDAHYDARLFGIWCIVGPLAEIVFPRAGLRLAAGPGSITIFDPFEVHGVLAPDCSRYSADDYEDAEASVFLGFELDITPMVAEAFGISAAVHGRVISSRTRIAADSGALEVDQANLSINNAANNAAR